MPGVGTSKKSSRKRPIVEIVRHVVIANQRPITTSRHTERRQPLHPMVQHTLIKLTGTILVKC